MPIYMRFLQNGTPIRGSAGSADHTNWIKVEHMSWPTAASTPPVSEIVITKLTDVHSTQFMPEDTGGIAAQVDFTRTHGRDGEITDLRILIHNVRIVRHERVARPGRATPVERMVLRYSKMTRAGGPKLSPDISHEVRARVERYYYCVQLFSPAANG